MSALLIERGIDEGPSHTEEDNDLFHFFNQVYVLVDTLWISTKKTVQNVLDSLSIPTYLFLKMNTSTLVSNSIDGETDNCFQKLGIYLRIIVGAPIRSVSFEIRARKSLITENIDNIAYNLGNLIQKLPGKNFNELDTIKTFITTGRNEDVKSIVDRMEIILDISASKAAKTISSRLFDICTTLECYKESNVASPPSFLTRHWPILLLLLKFGPQFSFGFYNNRDEIYRWIRCNLFDTVTGFLKDWLIKPMYDMLSVIRHDDSSSELSITTKESLQSDLDSLERMVIDYTIDYENPMVTKDLPAFQKEIHNAVKEGNLTVLMSKYEQDIRTPFKSTIKGSLPRALLIQLQKTKVDGAIAINGIDKLLKSQQLVFGMVSISPSIFIVYQLWQFARSQIFDKPLVINGKQVNLVCLKCLNNIEKYLNIYSEVGEEQKVYIEGFILIEILNLKRQSLKILPNNIHEMWISDLNDVNDDEWSIEGRLRIMSRLWSVYGHYFK